jgi:hypothetical protein
VYKGIWVSRKFDLESSAAVVFKVCIAAQRR